MPGSRKGCKNKHSFNAELLAQKFDKEPLEILLMVAHGDWEGLGYKSPTKTIFTAQGIEFEEDVIKVEARVSAAEKACKYLYTAKHALKISQDPLRDALDITPEKRSLEQLKAIAEAGAKEMEAIQVRIKELEATKLNE